MHICCLPLPGSSIPTTSRPLTKQHVNSIQTQWDVTSCELSLGYLESIGLPFAISGLEIVGYLLLLSRMCLDRRVRDFKCDYMYEIEHEYDFSNLRHSF